jgi:hypothetical protein
MLVVCFINGLTSAFTIPVHIRIVIASWMIFEVVAFFVNHVRTTAEVESKRTDPKVDLTTENAGHGLVSTPAI